LPEAFKGENFMYREESLGEVWDLKKHLASQNQGLINVTSEVIKKGVMLPEEAPGVEPRMDRM
jgi:hypothetical protein